MLPEAPVNAEEGLFGEANEPPKPETMLHVPVPEVGVFAAMLVLVPQTAWSGPALAMVVAGVTVIVPVAVEEQPWALVTVTV